MATSCREVAACKYRWFICIGFCYLELESLLKYGGGCLNYSYLVVVETIP